MFKILITCIFIFLYYNFSISQVHDSLKIDKIYQKKKQEFKISIPIFKIDTCYNHILDLIVINDSLRPYYKPKITLYELDFDIYEKSAMINISPIYLDSLVFKKTTFGVVIYKNRFFLCNRNKTDLEDKTEIFIPTNELYQFSFVEAGWCYVYWSQEPVSVLKYENCSNKNVYFFLIDIINDESQNATRKRFKLLHIFRRTKF
jgi:hypothetical protein